MVLNRKFITAVKVDEIGSKPEKQNSTWKSPKVALTLERKAILCIGQPFFDYAKSIIPCSSPLPHGLVENN